ncbi:MAG: hypothetical protein Satyrvirus14_13 [Satyrvirus sp.]|uniref:Uncharacterized protein n=1 Tax=Satyrvirus sp. TaxID=2487771 RepID=A0A3G5ADZ9_9VIRU|nr:MAG: hypothetical protein Satyrvirus14_13 [Satyrvirus sp.]
MGALGSKENLAQVVAIYGYNSNDIPWQICDNRSVYHTTGLIIKHDDKKYIVTTRNKLVGCKNIVMYHTYFNGIDPVMRNDLHILFQSIEFNIIILGTVDKNEFDIGESEVVRGDYDPKFSCPSYSILDNIFTIPTKRSQYHIIRMGADLESNIFDYKVDIRDVKFKKLFIDDKTFLPRNYMYKFIMDMDSRTDKKNLFGICGSIIFNKKHKLLGMVSKKKSDKIYVIPTKNLAKVAFDFVTYIVKHDEYNGLLTLPFIDEITSTGIIKSDHEFASPKTFVSENYIRNSEYNLSKIEQQLFSVQLGASNSNQKILKGDKLISVNGKNLIFDGDEILIYDDDYKINIPIDIYVKLNATNNISISRSNKILQLCITCTPINNFPLTNQPYFFPNCSIPFINLEGIIIVQLTHELLDITMSNKIVLDNNIINDLKEDNYGKTMPKKIFIVIDCLNKMLSDKYNLPRIVVNKNQTTQCPIVVSINGQQLIYLDDNLFYKSGHKPLITIKLLLDSGKTKLEKELEIVLNNEHNI